MEVRLHPLEFTQRSLPPVCAVTGERADIQLRMEVSAPVHPASFLLLLLGPLGWIVLLYVLTRSDGAYVDVPVSRQVMDGIKEKRRRGLWSMAVLVATLIAVVLLGNAVYPGSWVLFLPLIGLGIWVGRVDTHRIRLRADSLGLVSVRNVHPQFAAAVQEWRRNSPIANPRL